MMLLIGESIYAKHEAVGRPGSPASGAGRPSWQEPDDSGLSVSRHIRARDFPAVIFASDLLVAFCLVISARLAGQ